MLSFFVGLVTIVAIVTTLWSIGFIIDKLIGLNEDAYPADTVPCIAIGLFASVALGIITALCVAVGEIVRGR